jgi:hypothetical protein
MRLRHRVLILALVLCSAAARAHPGGPLPEPSPEKLPRWRGFNLMEKVDARDPRPYREEDFRLISRLGFNFVRLPLDYRIWIVGGDWARIDEGGFRGIDQAVEWGRRYGIHVCLNLHRAPGYCVNPPAEPRDLFSDLEAQRACAEHWAHIARRYRGIPSRNLSFNLLNEPATDDGAAYARVVSLMCRAIRAEDPERLIIADGLSYGTRPCPEIAGLHVAQSTRGYRPFSLTHYRADWVEGAADWPVPSWPPLPVSAFLYGPGQPELQSPLVIHGPFRDKTRLRIRVHQVSALSRLRVMADGAPILDRVFRPGPGIGEWSTPLFEPRWKIWQNIYDRDMLCTIPAGTRLLTMANEDGDWLSVSELAFLAPGAAQEALLTPGDNEWGRRQGEVRVDLAGGGRTFQPADGGEAGGAGALWELAVIPFREVEALGVGVVVGEWGAYRFTPHDVVLAWMRDCLENWRRAGWGWALWNFRGAFGVLDSNRPDAPYEEWEGHRLDRQMLELLQRY